MSCPKCGAAVDRHPGPGRPSLYCSPACRQAAAYEIKRLQRRLEGFELRRSAPRVEKDGIRDYLGRTRREQLADIEQQIKADEDRLRLLLAEPRGKPLPDEVGV